MTEAGAAGGPVQGDEEAEMASHRWGLASWAGTTPVAHFHVSF